MRNGQVATHTHYGSWIPTKLITVPGILSAVFAALAFLFPTLVIVAAVFLVCFLYFAYARYLFSPRGGNIQAKVRALVLDHMADWDGVGRVLDIGCGSGALTIQIAKQYPQAAVIGVDNWGAAWEYSKGLCVSNAEIEGVGGRVSFENASASSLPFADGAFDLVVSNLVFHEVREVRDKKHLIGEALRVLRPGGRFVFQDLFLWKQVYGDLDDLLVAIRGMGVETVEFVNTSESQFIPRLVKLPFMLGTVGLLFGSK